MGAGNTGDTPAIPAGWNIFLTTSFGSIRRHTDRHRNVGVARAQFGRPVMLHIMLAIITLGFITGATAQDRPAAAPA
jgi:hypothetical protein